MGLTEEAVGKQGRAVAASNRRCDLRFPDLFTTMISPCSGGLVSNYDAAEEWPSTLFLILCPYQMTGRRLRLMSDAENRIYATSAYLQTPPAATRPPVPAAAAPIACGP